MENLTEVARVDDAVFTEGDERLKRLGPAVVDFRLPEAVPGSFVDDLGVVEDDRVGLESRHPRDAAPFDLLDELGAYLVVPVLVFGKGARLESQRERATNHRPLLSVASGISPVLIAWSSERESKAAGGASATSRPR